MLLLLLCRKQKTKRTVASFQVFRAVLLKIQISTKNTIFIRKGILDKRCSLLLVL